MINYIFGHNSQRQKLLIRTYPEFDTKMRPCPVRCSSACSNGSLRQGRWRRTSRGRGPRCTRSKGSGTSRGRQPRTTSEAGWLHLWKKVGENLGDVPFLPPKVDSTITMACQLSRLTLLLKEMLVVPPFVIWPLYTSLLWNGSSATFQ